MQVVILAGGIGTRLKPLTENIPKSMIKVGGKPFLEYQIDLLKQQKIKDIVLCVGYLADKIKDYFGNGMEFGVRIEYSEEGERLLGTAGAIKKAEHLLQDTFFVMYGDSYLPMDFAAAMAYFRRFNKVGLVLVYKNYNQYDASNIVVDDNMVKKYSKREKTRDMVYIDYGLSIFRKEILALIPPDKPWDLEEVFTDLVNRKELLAFEVYKRFYQIGSPEGLHDFEQYISQGVRMV